MLELLFKTFSLYFKLSTELPTSHVHIWIGSDLIESLYEYAIIILQILQFNHAL
jgi:hypothetical protein